MANSTNGAGATSGTQGGQDPKTSTAAAGAQTGTAAQKKAVAEANAGKKVRNAEPIQTKEKNLSQINQAFGFITHQGADTSTPTSGVYFQELAYEGEGDDKRVTGMDEKATQAAYDEWKGENPAEAEYEPAGTVPNPAE